VFHQAQRSSRWLLAAVALSATLCVAEAAAAADPDKAPIVVPVVIVGQFSDDQRNGIRQAADEWNRTLNGHIRFEIQPNTGAAKVWAVTAVPKSPVNNKGEVLGETVTLPSGGRGLVMVYLDRLGNRSVEGVILHEFGHVLGLQHEPGHGLMSATYNPHAYGCVDYSAAAQVAKLYNVPLREFRWCGEAPPASN
jgi:hypothetical protein